MMTPRPTTGDSTWFTHARFGMFIHWGLYALGARHEWLQHNEQIAPDTYAYYLEHFDPDLFDPDEWAERAWRAGMRYVVITAKHHEGFCLFDSAHTDFKATNAPAGRDLLREAIDAFRARGLRIGLYYSLIDWHHPHFTIDSLHPLRNATNVEELNRGRDMAVYRQYLRDQVTELLTGYGRIDVLFYDFSYPNTPQWPVGKGREDWGSEELIALTRTLQPGILVNDRLDLPREHVDIFTPEQYQPVRWVQIDGEPVTWETCQTFSGSWGYHRDETSWKSPGQLVRMLVDTVSCGGNLLMNVGPTSRGTLDHRAIAALEAYAGWMETHERAIRGCTAAEFDAPRDCRLTQDGDRLYIHITTWPFKQLHAPGLAGRVEYAQLLHDGSEVKFHEIRSTPDQAGHVDMGLPEGTLTFELPVHEPPVLLPVIEVFLKG